MFSFVRRAKPKSRLVAAAAASSTPEPATPLVRQPADRSAHLDDQHLVFWNAKQSQTSAEQLSESAATWHQAVRNQPAMAPPELPRIARA